MANQVSEKIAAVLRQLTDEEKVQKALKFIEEDQENIIQKQIELTLIPAPTGQEEKKAKRLLEMFAEEGLTDCHIDPYGNAVGIRRGTGNGKTVLVEGHMDTVFPIDTKLEIRRENGWIYCPGIVDDTRGCAVVLSVIRALNAAGIETAGSAEAEKNQTADEPGQKNRHTDTPYEIPEENELGDFRKNRVRHMLSQRLLPVPMNRSMPLSTRRQFF